MGWTAIDIAPPPRDRVIEITSGGAWTYEDQYSGPDARRDPSTTQRYWSFRGAVLLVIWRTAADLDGTAAMGEGAFMDTHSGGIAPPFRFWREYDNPLADTDGLLTSTVPPHGFHEQFDGDARLRLYDDMEATVRRGIEQADRSIADWQANGRPPSESVLRSRAMGETRLAEVVAARAHAYDPYPLPAGVVGVSRG